MRRSFSILFITVLALAPCYPQKIVDDKILIYFRDNLPDGWRMRIDENAVSVERIDPVQVPSKNKVRMTIVVNKETGERIIRAGSLQKLFYRFRVLKQDRQVPLQKHDIIIEHFILRKDSVGIPDLSYLRFGKFSDEEEAHKVHSLLFNQPFPLIDNRIDILRHFNKPVTIRGNLFIGRDIYVYRHFKTVTAWFRIKSFSDHYKTILNKQGTLYFVRGILRYPVTSPDTGKDIIRTVNDKRDVEVYDIEMTGAEQLTTGSSKTKYEKDSSYVYRDGQNNVYKLVRVRGVCFFEFIPMPIEHLGNETLKNFKVKMDSIAYNDLTRYLVKLTSMKQALTPEKVMGSSAIYLPGSGGKGYYLERNSEIKNQADSIFKHMGDDVVPFDLGNTRNRAFTGMIITRKFVNKGGSVTDHDEYFFKPTTRFGFILQDSAEYYIKVPGGKYKAEELRKLVGKKVIITTAVGHGSMPIPGGSNGPEGRGGIYMVPLTIQQMHDD